MGPRYHFGVRAKSCGLELSAGWVSIDGGGARAVGSGVAGQRVGYKAQRPKQVASVVTSSPGVVRAGSRWRYPASAAVTRTEG